MITLVAVAGADGARAACLPPQAVSDFAAAVRAKRECEQRRLAGAAVTCEPTGTICAAEIDQIAMLAFAANAPAADLRAWRAEARCQRRLARAAESYVVRRVRDLFAGRRDVPFARAFLRRVVRRCQNVRAEAPLPAIGGPCAAAATRPFSPERVAACLRPALEAAAQATTGVAVPPNVLLVLTDDQRWDTLDVMPAVRDRLAARGVAFPNAFVATSLCCPDRATLLTGLYAHSHGVTSNAGARVFDHDRDTIARRLREQAGYRTALVGKYMVGTGAALGAAVPPGWDAWHVFTSDTGPFGLYYGYSLNTDGQVASYGLDEEGRPVPAEYSTDLLRDRVLALLATWHDVPFFVMYAPFAPHTPAIPPDRHAGRFAGLAPWRPPSHAEADLSGKPTWVATQAFFQMLLGNAPARVDATRINQLETLLAVDEAVERFDAILESYGLADNTLVLFTSDNGFLWLEHWLTLKNYPYEESVRVPFIIRYPVLAPVPGVVPALVQSIDVYPTLADLAGVDHPVLPGRSLRPLLTGEAPAWRDAILLEHWAPGAGIDTSVAVRTERWKLIETFATAGVTTELYDLATDPFELSNLAGDPAQADVLAALHARLATLLLD